VLERRGPKIIGKNLRAGSSLSCVTPAVAVTVIAHAVPCRDRGMCPVGCGTFGARRSQNNKRDATTMAWQCVGFPGLWLWRVYFRVWLESLPRKLVPGGTYERAFGVQFLPPPDLGRMSALESTDRSWGWLRFKGQPIMLLHRVHIPRSCSLHRGRLQVSRTPCQCVLYTCTTLWLRLVVCSWSSAGGVLILYYKRILLLNKPSRTA
jgi:hypothetical protein